MRSTNTVLFVDVNDERTTEIERSGLPREQGWAIEAVSNSDEALDLLAHQEYCLVVVHLNVPGMDGIDLLRKARELQPLAARFLLLGRAMASESMRAGSVAHQVLAAETSTDELLESFVRAIGLRTVLADVELRCAAANLDRLPSAPRTYLAIREAAADPDTSTAEIAAIIEHDVALTASILRLVNSSVFGLAQPTDNILHAVAHVGLDIVRTLCLSTEVTTKFTDNLPEGFSFDEQQRHVHRVTQLLGHLVTDKKVLERTILAAFLHDVGTLIQVTQLPEEFTRIHSMDEHVRMTLSELERRVLDVTHAELGAHLLGLWGLPFEIVEAVAYHHEPSRGRVTELGVLGWLHIADSLVEEIDGPPSGGKPSHLDAIYLRSAGVTPEQMQAWRERAHEVLNAEDEDEAGTSEAA